MNISEDILPPPPKEKEELERLIKMTNNACR